MRDPKRIPEMLQLLGEYWMKYPDMRLTQIVSNAAALGGWVDLDSYHCEDNVTRNGLIMLIQNAENSGSGQ